MAGPATRDKRAHEHIAEARTRWPGVAVDAARFTQRWAECWRDDVPPPHAVDLYLAIACACGDANALALFDQHFLSKVAAFVARVDRSPAFADEIRQRLRESLLVGKSGRPGIATFSGRGALSSWVHVAALRTALDLRRSEGDVRESPTVEAFWADTHPELGYIKERYRTDFRAAFAASLSALAPPERRLLRMHFVDGLSLSQIGTVEKLDKSNVSRRLATIRRAVLADMRERLKARLGIEESALDSLLDVMQSQLDISIERLLGRSHTQ